MALAGPLVVIALLVVRSPTIMAHGRLWAEEAQFLAHMLATDSVVHQLFYVYRGHIELLSSVVFAMASRLDARTIPLVTTYAGVLVECVLAFMLVFFRKDLGIRLGPALLICVLIVVSPCAVEHYLNMLNSVWLISAILLLVINLPPERMAGHGPLLVLSTLVMGLSGIPATCLMPLALLHAVVWRSRPHLLVAAMLTLCCVIQGLLVLVNGAQDRFSSVSAWVYLAAPFSHIVLEHLLGVEAASALGHWFKDSAMNAAAVPTLMLAPLAFLVWTIARLFGKGATRSSLLLVALIYTATFNIAFALGNRDDLFSVYGMRYFFVPSFALALSLARIGKASSHSRSDVRRDFGPGSGLGLMLFVATISTVDFFRDPFYATYVESGHPWRSEVAQCEKSAAACSIEIDPGHVTVDIPDRILRRAAR